VKNTSKINQKIITYEIEDKFHNISEMDLSTKEIFWWYKDFTEERERPPTIFEMVDEFERLKREEVIHGLRNDFGYAEIMFGIYETESLDEIALNEVQEMYRENNSIINDLITDIYDKLGLSLLFEDADYGFIDLLDFSSSYINNGMMILGAQVPVFKTLRSSGRGISFNDKFYGGV